ncbi:uncharacterized protein CPUR_07071 [Claviceps purpurea 20.1]|uniref:Uncharacterized protein n=1 Tax=Claviceps purpurea (strain 20.1) TaxID=1111077 RepID=M1VXJ8_CLAP2|nr:uncharacterized protein CPUR_07071 [Claviceps purpurea 20.1]
MGLGRVWDVPDKDR